MPEARASTETEVANLALSHCKEPPIGDLAEDDARARVCRVHFGTARDATLQGAHWSFAKAWAAPAKDTSTSLGPLKNRFPLPGDCIAVRSVDELERTEWDIENATVAIGVGSTADVLMLVTNADAVTICYTKRVDNPSLWTPQFVEAFGYELGSAIASELGRSDEMTASLASRGRADIDTAARHDGRQRQRQTVSRDVPFTRARQ